MTSVEWTPKNGERVWIKVFSNWSLGTYIGFDTIENTHLVREDVSGGGSLMSSSQVLPESTYPNVHKQLTAEDFLQDHLEISHFYDDKTQNMVCYSDDVQKAMIEFAKLHVEAAIKSCIEEAPSGSSTDTVSYEDVVEALKDCYPLENIK